MRSALAGRDVGWGMPNWRSPLLWRTPSPLYERALARRRWQRGRWRLGDPAEQIGGSQPSLRCRYQLRRPACRDQRPAGRAQRPIGS